MKTVHVIGLIISLLLSSSFSYADTFKDNKKVPGYQHILCGQAVNPEKIHYEDNYSRNGRVSVECNNKFFLQAQFLLGKGERVTICHAETRGGEMIYLFYTDANDSASKEASVVEAYPAPSENAVTCR